MVDVSPLRSRVSGPVLTADDPGFADEVRGWLLNFESTPDVVVGATSASDVVEAVKFACANGLRVRAQGTGHGADVPVTDGLLITTKRLDSLSIDPATRLATIGAGLEWGRVVSQAAPLGLVPILGSSSTVGAVGFLLGGGLGPLVRSHGFGSDWVRGFELVTGEGDLVRASIDDNPDLFWALRGGKGGLGVVTGVTVELAPVGTIYGGSLMFDGANIRAALGEWVRYLETVDPDVSTSFSIMRMPDLPFIPEKLRGHTLVSIRFAYPGEAADGERLAAPLRAGAPVYFDGLTEMSVANMDAIHGDPTEPTIGWTRSRALGAIDQELVDVLLDHADAGKDFPFIALEVRHLGGAAATDVPEGSAVSGREAKGMVTLVGVPNQQLFESVIPRVADSVWESIGPWLDPQNNVNFAMPFATQHAYEAVWPAETFARLATVRKKYDPKGTFVYGF